MAVQVSDVYRAMAIFQGVSNTPEDRYVNTWHFRNDYAVGSPEEPQGAITRALTAFYFGTTEGGDFIARYMSRHIVGVEFRIYDLGQPGSAEEPREPIITAPQEEVSFGQGTRDAALPQEVAVVLSTRTARRGARGRGRTYLGPLTVAAMEEGGSVPRVDGMFRDTIVDRAEDLLNTAENITWCVLSTTSGEVYPVTGGYVDDAFDTQRRRGLAPTTRRPFGGYQVAA